MMQMLDRGGIPALTDEIRTADHDNPKGYYEYERVKRTKEDPTWLPLARGKVVKLVSSLLYDLPQTESYRVLFMRREIDEVLDSQEKMLARLNRPAAPRESMKKSFAIHLERLFHWLPWQSHIKCQEVNYHDLISQPQRQAALIAEFLERQLDQAAMQAAVDHSLYRNRRQAGA